MHTMIEKLKRLVDEIGAVHSKLILLVGGPGIGKTALLVALAESRHATALNVGAELGSRLAPLSQRQRLLQANTIFRELADRHVIDDLLLVDNIELLFDRTLQLDPLDLLKRHAYARRVVAVWPGALQGELHGNAKTGRLTYAHMGHPEYQDYGLEGVFPFELQE